MDNDGSNIVATDEKVMSGGAYVKALVVSSVVVLVAMLTLFFLRTMVYIMTLASGGLESTQIEQHMVEIGASSIFSLSGIIISILVATMGGYVCAKIARADTGVYRVVVGVAVLAALLSYAPGAAYLSMQQSVAVALVTFCSSFLGVWLYSQKNKK
jgi:hypothetical protein